MSAEAFRPFAVDSPRLAKTVRTELEVAKQDNFHAAMDATDWADFRYKRGIIEGIEIALAICTRHEEPN